MSLCYILLVQTLGPRAGAPRAAPEIVHFRRSCIHEPATEGRVCSKKIEWTLGCRGSLRAYSAGILTSQRGLHVLPIMWRRLRGAAFIIASVTRRKHTISSLSTVKWTSLLSLATRPLDAGSLFVLAQSRREDASLDGRGQQVGTWSSLEACRLLASNGITVEFKGIAGMSTHASYHDWLQS